MSEEGTDPDAVTRFQGLTAAEELVQKILSHRQEILTAFIAKYGYEPDEAVQINAGNRWTVQKIDPEERKAIVQMVVGAQVQERFVADVELLLNWTNESQLEALAGDDVKAAYHRLQGMLQKPNDNENNKG